MAITHNPVIAAAADTHIVVNKGVTKLVGPGNTSIIIRGKSKICRLESKVDREKEIGRMATGNLNTKAGEELARALLEQMNKDNHV